MALAASQNRYAGGPSPSGLADVLDLILDKGLVIDIYVRVSLVGIELLTIDARIVVATPTCASPRPSAGSTSTPTGRRASPS
jgi:hypothetical protein